MPSTFLMWDHKLYAMLASNALHTVHESVTLANPWPYQCLSLHSIIDVMMGLP